TRGRFRYTSRERDLHRLRDAVMNHLHRNVYGGLARNENDAPPIGCFHPRQVMAREAHAAHKVCFDNRVPVCVSDLLEWFDLVYAKIIDQNNIPDLIKEIEENLPAHAAL